MQNISFIGVNIQIISKKPTSDEAQIFGDFQNGVFVLVRGSPHKFHVSVHKRLVVPPRGAKINDINRLARVVIQEIRIIRVGLDKPPLEQFSNGDDQHRAGDGVAHLLRECYGLVDGVAGDQFGGEDALGAEFGVHLGHLAVPAEYRVSHHITAILLLARCLANVIT